MRPNRSQVPAYRRTVMNVEAADALCTAPLDGVTNAYKCVEDLLDVVQTELAAAGLCDRLAVAPVQASAGDPAAWEGLSEELRQAVERIHRSEHPRVSAGLGAHAAARAAHRLPSAASRRSGQSSSPRPAPTSASRQSTRDKSIAARNAW